MKLVKKKASSIDRSKWFESTQHENVYLRKGQRGKITKLYAIRIDEVMNHRSSFVRLDMSVRRLNLHVLFHTCCTVKAA